MFTFHFRYTGLDLAQKASIVRPPAAGKDEPAAHNAHIRCECRVWGASGPSTAKVACHRPVVEKHAARNAPGSFAPGEETLFQGKGETRTPSKASERAGWRRLLSRPLWPRPQRALRDHAAHR